MSAAGLVAGLAAAVITTTAEVLPLGAPSVHGLRPYQVEAVERACAELRTQRSTLIVMPTGTGKTTVFAEMIRRARGRCLVLAHRDELIQQAQRRLEAATGTQVDLEQAGFHASKLFPSPVVASVQTLSRPGRLGRWPTDAFTLIVIDEAHHATAKTYRRILDHFPGAKIVGVTATPDRSDETALGQVFATSAYVYAIADAIRDGWLCGIKACSVRAAGINLATVKTTAGDLNAAQLDGVMKSEENLHAVAQPTIALAGDRRTLVFTTSVENAHRLAEIFNRYKPDSARAVDGGTARDDRRDIFRDHREGRFQYLVNVGIAVEGYDDPGIACVAMGRPTKSRALYCQMTGRGLRPAPGKTDLLVLDFVGNAGKHKLVSALDVLGGKLKPEVVERARRDLPDGDVVDVATVLENAEVREKRELLEAARRAQVQAHVRFKTYDVDPFAVLGVKQPAHKKWDGRFGAAPASPKQIDCLVKFGLPVPANLSKTEAQLLIGAAIKRSELGLASPRQLKVLRKHGLPTNVRFETASRLIDALGANNWRGLGPDQVAAITGRERAA